ncbi:MAG: ATP phosphoribosyltransferase regulatory subunit [Thermoanaerobacteraceae bacterium]|uniref:ATP phosphoribosyltransferase regulatory subunit n=1 Tax=Thermanaeromonas sp. C210 TaxID=2731925 RepID=UPI00155D17B4|nr:ATP phosphoribosyltransferase regulatory subunit [Thermanaeromonas sp. C210]MBE3581243.1 ATP phosphoribosyltransferase regulatory subunit [Thermoanaerobacteraceae bacterium]GFN22207.1 ATP phosphoribosyltransferase regulatory subunit [Thermanaeromonas sp. C210]
MNLNRQLQLPEGVDDFLPGAAAAKRDLEYKLLTLFQGWGYQEVVTPTFEFVEVFQAGQANGSEDVLYKFIDRQGRVLALRPEMTAPIARLVATRLKREKLPLRLCYSATVFRYEDPARGRRREFNQAGVELLGASGVGADCEVVALAVEALLQAGLKEFRIGLGQVAVTKGVLAELNLPGEALARVKEAMVGKDWVRLSYLCEEYGLKGDARRCLELLFTLHGGREALRGAGPLSKMKAAREPLEHLEEVLAVLERYGLGSYLFIDLGILRDFDYYTGLVFEGYTAGLGFPVLGGGRYDELLQEFGYPCPATGFAVGLERVLTVRNGLGSPPEESPTGYLVAGEDLAEVLLRARELRLTGARVQLAWGLKTPEEAAGEAAERKLTPVWVSSRGEGE